MDKHKIIEKFGGEYMVTPDTFHMGIHKILGGQIAQRFKGFKRVLDTCVGAGFMTLQIARTAEEVVAVDINPQHLEMAKENAARAGLSNITFILGNILDKNVIEQLGLIDGAFLDPDWAKEGDSKEIHVTSLGGMVPNGETLFNTINKLTPNIAYRLPKEFDKTTLPSLPPFEEEKNIMDGKVKFFTYYFGNLKI